MAPIPYALSVHHFISTYGAYAGFASVLGLAILVLLFFSQARDGALLRHRAEDAEEELRSLQSYVSQLSRALEQVRIAAEDSRGTGPIRVAPPPAAALVATPAPGREMPVPSPAVVPAPRPTVGAIPFAPAGVGAPALSSATRLIPAGAADQIAIRAMSAPGVLSEETDLEAGDAEDQASEELAMATVAVPSPAQSEAPAGNGASAPSDLSVPTAPAPPGAPVPAARTAEPAGPPPSTAAGSAHGGGRSAQA
ncbi:MAG: hypothetical protein ACRDL8_09975, partial [Solirubrobacteraceae bacterium]